MIVLVDLPHLISLLSRRELAGALSHMLSTGLTGCVHLQFVGRSSRAPGLRKSRSDRSKFPYLLGKAQREAGGMDSQCEKEAMQ
jgi:hypothetical protein